MSGRWFRFYDDAVNDPKVQRLPPPLFRFWINALCLASKSGGILPCRPDMEFALRLTTAQLSDFIGRLVTAELLDVDGETLSPHNWNGRQYKSDVSTERVKRFRERLETVSVTTPETEQSRAETEQKDISSLRSDTSEPEGFQEFYEKYPRREGRRTAARAFKTALKRAPPETILAGAARYSIATLGTERHFVKLPATWLNGDHWKDEGIEGTHNGRQHKPNAHDRFLEGIASHIAKQHREGGEVDSGPEADRGDPGATSHTLLAT